MATYMKNTKLVTLLYTKIGFISKSWLPVSTNRFISNIYSIGIHRRCIHALKQQPRITFDDAPSMFSCPYLSAGGWAIGHPFLIADWTQSRRGKTGSHGPICEQECWKCGKSIDADAEQYFCICGVVQPPVSNRSLFQVLGIKETFDIDTKLLTERYRSLQTILHPDKYSQKSEIEKSFSVDHSSLVNKAYSTLMKPLSRGLYLLRLREEDLEKEQHMKPDFLSSILELNEALLEADSLEAIQKLGEQNQAVLDDLVQRVSEAFKRDDPATAKELLLQIKYYANIDDKVKERIRMHSDELQ